MNSKLLSISDSYFSLANGEWNFNVNFAVHSWEEFRKSDLSFINKMRFVTVILGQHFLGRFSMWTRVDFKTGSTQVHHSTRLKKWRITIFRSEKKFQLASDGAGLRLEGVEYYWPLFWLPIPFNQQTGIVEDSGTRARYQMPFLGITCDCQTFLEPPRGEIRLQTKWLSAYFTMTQESISKLAERAFDSSLNSSFVKVYR